MLIEYQYTFGLPRKIVWKHLRDQEILHKSLPGCKSFVQTAKNAYKAEMDINIGPFSDVCKLEILLDKEKPHSSFMLHVKGKGNIGELKGDIFIFLTGSGSRTELACKAEGQVTGALAIPGERILTPAAAKGLDRFFQTVEKEIKRTLYQLKRR